MATKKRDYKLEYAKRKVRAVIKAREVKRGKPLSPNYIKRIQSGLLKGKTLQQARGHKPQEHIERKRQHEPTQGPGVGDKRQTYIFQWFVKRDFEIADWEIDPVEGTKYASMKGWEWFLNYSKIWEDTRETYISELKAGRYASRGLGHLQYLTDTANAPEMSWLYYH